MNQKATRIVLTVAVLGIAFSALLYSSLGENLQYYKYVDEVMAEPTAWEGQPLRVHGYVVPGSIGRKRDSREYKFQMQHNGKVLTAYHSGTIPDGFKDDAEVVLTGTLQGDSFVSNHIEAKCPSKYEERPTDATGL